MTNLQWALLIIPGYLLGMFVTSIIIRIWERHSPPIKHDDGNEGLIFCWPLALALFAGFGVAVGSLKLCELAAKKIIPDKKRIEERYTSEDLEEVEKFLEEESHSRKIIE